MIKDAVFWKNVIMGADRNALMYLQSEISSECQSSVLRKAFIRNRTRGPNADPSR